MVPLCRYAFLSIVVASMGTAQSAWLFKNLRAKQIAKASMAAMLLWHALAAPLLRYRLALFLKDILPFALLPPTSTRPRLARRHQGLLLPLHLRMALLAV